jgi:prevent-host-death family protein
VATRDYTDRMIASVRGAKARLSELLERAAGGEEIVIAAAGRPKAKLVGLGETAPRPFRVNRALLRGRVRKGTRAERHVRAERDSRD